jgi:thiol-disulfide isomerase/thioredoxin
MRWVPLALILLLVGVPVSSAPPKISGLWDAAIVADQFEIPFRFEIVQNGDRVQGFFFEGDRKVGSTSGTLQNGNLRLEYDFLNTTFDATFDGDQFHGTYRVNVANAAPMAVRGHRFAPVPAETASTPQVAGNWVMYRTAPDGSKLDVSWRLYLRQSGSAVSGAILKTSGDSGELTGRWNGNTLVLSHFDGDRPLLMEAKPNSDGTLAIQLNDKFTYRAARTNEARAKGLPDPPDPSRFTSVKDPSAPFHFSGLALDGRTVSDADAEFHNKAVILSIGGTWCANCQDEFPFLVELYNQYHARGLEVVGLSFELDPDLARAKPRVLAFMKRHSVGFPMLIPGTPDEVSAKLPQLVNFGVYPTTVFLGRDGRVRSVHAGFASAATGDEHVRLEREERELVERLVSEGASGQPPKSSSAPATTRPGQAGNHNG